MQWLKPDGPVTLERGAVHVWRAMWDPGRGGLARFMRLLPPDEQERAAAFRNEEGKTAFIICRFLLRRLLAAYTGMPGSTLALVYGPNGRPELRDVPELRFSISHTGHRALLAFARDAAIGVDIEDVNRRVEPEALAERFFTPAEFQEFDSLPTEMRRQAFFLCWTRKEALAKALGVGVPAALKQFSVSLAPGVPPALTWMQDEPTAPASWTLQTINPWPECAGAVAIEAPGREVECFDGSCWLEAGPKA